MKQILSVMAFASLVLFLGSCSSIKPEDYAKLKADNANLSDENQNLMNDLSQTKKDLSALQNQRDELQQELAKYSNDNISLKNQVDSTRGALGRQVDSLNASIKGNNLKIAGLQDEIKSRDSQIGDLQKTISSLSAAQAKQLQEENMKISNITETHDRMEAAMQSEIANGDMDIKQLGDILSVDFQDKIFFDSGRADIRDSGKRTLDKLVGVLKNVTDKQIRVEGYTDNVPIAPDYRWKFPSNWELSTARATTIVRYLQSQGIDPALLKATGYGEYNPVASNETAEGRQQNRRIVVLLVPLDERARFR